MSLPSDGVPVEIDGFGEGFQRCGCVQGAVRPVLIVVDLVRVQDPPQMGLVPDEGAVQELASASADPAFDDRVHALLAVTANSPIAGGHDTGWASWRYPIQARWPTAVLPAAWPDAAAYDTAVRRLIGRGAALDDRSVYFLARLSPRYPTVEVRVADVCLDAGTAVLLAGLIRALVATAPRWPQYAAMGKPRRHRAAA